MRLLGWMALQARGLTRPSPRPLEKLIHDGRTLIKRTRALLWFARPALDPEAFAQARDQLRQAAGLLAAQRDLAATRSVLQKLKQKVSGSVGRLALADLRQMLVLDSATARVPEKSLRRTLRNSMGLLPGVMDEIEQSATERTGWTPPRRRLAKALSDAHAAARQARREGTDVAFHNWRKKAKRLLYLLELTRKRRCGRGPGTLKRVHALQALLGDYHDCVVVEEQLHRMSVPPPGTPAIQRLLEKQKTRLAKKARSLGRP